MFAKYGLRLSNPRRIAYVGECAITIVVVKLDPLAFIVAGMAVRAVAWPMLAAPEIVFWRPLDVIGDDQIEPAVFIVIKPPGAG